MSFNQNTSHSVEKTGTVTLVGFGPGDPDLLTVKALKALQTADVIFYDDLVDQDFLQTLDAELVYVGKRSGRHHAEQEKINDLLLDAAREGKTVVRLKGGDPMIFGHAGEEIEYLESHGVHTEVIPGITAASALAANAKVSLTHRLLSSSVAYANGHAAQIRVPDADTLVYYMGASHLPRIAQTLIEAGLSPDTAVLLGYNVTRSDEQFWDTTLEALSDTTVHYPTPLIVMVGRVTELRRKKASEVLGEQ